MNTTDFLKQQVGVFKDFTPDCLKQLVDGSRVTSFEANEAILHQGAEATHFGVILSGTVNVSVLGDGGTFCSFRFPCSNRSSWPSPGSFNTSPEPLRRG
jgi:signal-transduction protein with cAMP-binding, CBS, and nucleotidyltransferase domain